VTLMKTGDKITTLNVYSVFTRNVLVQARRVAAYAMNKREHARTKNINERKPCMALDQPSGTDRRARSKQRMASLVASRNETLALYSDLASNRPYQPGEQTEEMVRRFCQALVDYAASAHFQLYRYIVENKERRQAVVDLAQQIYPQIAASTDAILDFNDRYDVTPLENRIGALADDLSQLGEMLADRIQLEDKVIDALDGVH
jgi:regulator of sigma D